MFLRNIKQQLELDDNFALFLGINVNCMSNSLLQPIAPIINKHLIVLLYSEYFLHFGQILIRCHLFGTQNFAEKLNVRSG